MTWNEPEPQAIVDDLNALEDTQYWTEVLAKAFKRRTGLPSDSTAVVVHRDDDTGEEVISFRAIKGYTEDGDPILVERIAFPWSLYERVHRVFDDHTLAFALAPWLLAGVSWLLLLLTRRPSKSG